MKKFIALILLAVMVSPAMGAQPEDALSSQPDDALYAVLRLEDTSRLIRWALSSENLKLIVPLITGSKSQAEILMLSEIISSVASNLPIRSAALIAGITGENVKLKAPFAQIAFTVSPELSGIVSKVADGTADAGDIAKLVLGDKFAAMFAETMIKVEHDRDNILRVNNDIFMTARDGLVILGETASDVKSSLKALSDEDSRLNLSRRFSGKDYAYLHADYETAAELDDEADDIDAREFFGKPLNVEFAFERLADKFLMSVGVNLTEALREKYRAMMLDTPVAVKGGNIDLEGVGGSTSPIAALGTHLDLASLKSNDVLAPAVKKFLRNLRVRFGITEAEAHSLFTGPFSAVINGTVTYEGFKLPAVYMSQTGRKGAAGKVYSRLTKSPHFSKVGENILQLDTSISPVSCLVSDRGETLGLDFAELSSLSEKPEHKPALSELMERKSTASMWIDFAGLQSWINDGDNGVFAALTPFAGLLGYGKYLRAAREVLSADFSVPAVSLWSEGAEVFHTEFAVKEINPDEGLFAKLLKVYQEFK